MTIAIQPESSSGTKPYEHLKLGIGHLKLTDQSLLTNWDFIMIETAGFAFCVIP
jgi:hypothetical protein